MAVTNNIREIREQRGIYQDDLAAAIGFSTKTVGRIERGDSTPSAEFMLRISKYFNLLVEDVFHVEDRAGNFISSSFFLSANWNLSLCYCLFIEIELHKFLSIRQPRF